MRTCYFEEDFLYPETRLHFHVFQYNFPEMHDHNYWEFFIIGSGEVTHAREDKTEILSEGSACLVHPWDKHKFVCASKGYEQINFTITDDYLRKFLGIISPDLYDRLTHIKHPINYDLSNNLLQEFYKMVHMLQTIDETDIEHYTSLNKCIWLNIITILYRNNMHTNTSYPDWLNDFLYKIRQPENIAKTISELCSLTFFSYSHLSRLFKQYTGETLNNYLVTLRLNYSAMLLRTTDTSILLISSTIGYDSLSHFMAMFKQRFHMTPKQYRKTFSFRDTPMPDEKEKPAVTVTKQQINPPPADES